jgi:tetratricopeptide (TPR) repeat protein
MPEVAIQTLAMAIEYFPGDADLVERLGTLYIKTKQHTLARQCFETLCELRPNDSRAIKLLKDAMAMDTMSKEWAGAAASGDFREAIKDRKEAEILEREAKSVRDASDIDSLIAENLSRVKREPKNINYRRALASLYLNNKMYDEAIKALEEALEVIAGRDPQVDNLLSQVKIQKFNNEISELRTAGDENEALKLEAVRDGFAFEDLQSRVTRYPNDLQLRYEFGILLKDRDRINDAIQQFQFAQRSPQFRARALYFIGICFASKQQYDMAADQLERALAEMVAMDGQKKATLYELGLIAEARGDHPKALEYFKDIYQTDIGYRDVSTRIEKGYGNSTVSNG